MISEAPPFWWKEADWRIRALSPFAWVYGRVARERMVRGRRMRLPVPVVCVGNFTVGGSGKTPTALALARAAHDAGRKPGMLSRGYGGSLDVPTLVDPGHHRGKDVGDEPLLLSAAATTVIARDRLAGARLLVENGCDMVIMDDGFQSAHLDHDYALIVVDASRGLGNGQVIPAGPVRAPVAEQIRHADALLTVGSGPACEALVRLAARAGKPVHEASLVAADPDRLKDRKVFAYAGIGDPGRFFRTVEQCGAEIVRKRAFGDHHPFTDEEMDDLMSAAERDGLQLVATAKDASRLKGLHGKAEDLLERTMVLDVNMVFDQPKTPGRIIAKAIENFKEKRLAGGAASQIHP